VETAQLVSKGRCLLQIDVLRQNTISIPDRRLEKNTFLFWITHDYPEGKTAFATDGKPFPTIQKI